MSRREERAPGPDLLRAATVAGVVVVHAAGTYAVDVGWYYREPTASFPLTVALSVPADVGLFFGLGPLFLLAGELSARSRERHGTASFLRRRLVRLGLPLLLYVAAVGPVTTALADGAGRTTTWTTALRDAYAAPDLGPMWFVGVLLVGTVAYALLRAWVPPPSSPAPGPTLRTLLGWAALVAVADLLVWLRWSYVRPSPAGANLAHWPQALGLFALGVVAGERGWTGGAPGAVRLRRAAGGTALVAAAVLLGLAAVVLTTVEAPTRLAGGLHGVTLTFAACDGLIAVGSSWWLVRRFRDDRRPPLPPLVRRAAQASFGAYVLHPPLLVALALLLRPTGWPVLLELVVLAVLGLVTSFAAGTLVHRLARAAAPRAQQLGQQDARRPRARRRYPPAPGRAHDLGPRAEQTNGRGRPGDVAATLDGTGQDGTRPGPVDPPHLEGELTMSRILVTYATRTGTTREVANAIADELVRLGEDVDVRPCRRSPSSYHYDAVVLGSAVHRGQWMPEALEFLRAEAPDLSERPTWLFQTGPCADGEPEGHVGATPAPGRVLERVREIGAAGPATFSRPEGDRGTGLQPSRWIATGPCFGPFGSEDGARSWAEMIAAFTPERRVPTHVEEDLGGGAGGQRQHPLASTS